MSARGMRARRPRSPDVRAPYFFPDVNVAPLAQAAMAFQFASFLLANCRPPEWIGSHWKSQKKADRPAMDGARYYSSSAIARTICAFGDGNRNAQTTAPAAAPASWAATNPGT